MFSAMKQFGWPSTQHGINGGVGSNGGNSAAYGWRRWEQWCLTFDMINARITHYADGHEDVDVPVNADQQFFDLIKGANKRIKEPDVVTDVLFG